MKKLTVRLKLRLKNAKSEPIPGWGIGVVAMQDYQFTVADNFTLDPSSSATMYEAMKQFRENCTEVDMEEIPNDQHGIFPQGGYE